jgi:hypothetical protein
MLFVSLRDTFKGCCEITTAEKHRKHTLYSQLHKISGGTPGFGSNRGENTRFIHNLAACENAPQRALIDFFQASKPK